LWAEKDEVGVPRLHIGRDMGHVLACVDERERTGGMGGGDELVHRRNRPEHVRHGADREQSGAGEQLVEIGQVQAEVGSQRDPAHLDAPFRREHLPWHDVRVVLQVRQHDLVAGLQIRARP